MLELTPEANQRARMILENLPRVKYIAASIHQRLPQTVVLEDLVSIGVLGLIEAVDRYDPSTNVQFKTFAEYRIRGSILDSICELDGIPAHKRSKAKRAKLAVSVLEQKLGRTPTSEEVAAELGVTMDEYHQWINDIRTISLGSLASSCATENGEISLADMIEDKESAQPEELMVEAERQELVRKGLNALPVLERQVARLYFQEGLCLRQIATILDLHITRVSKLKSRATGMMQRFVEVRCHQQKRGACV
jgi:RNA polymerase sigma factor for flagellar operon FliA